MADSPFVVPINSGTISHQSYTDAGGDHYPAVTLHLPGAGTPVEVNTTNPVPTSAASVGYQSSTTITRAANTTPYTANDVIGGALTISNIGPSGGHILIQSIRVILNITAVPSGMSTMFLFLYDVTPPSAVADNGAFTVASGDRASLLTPNGIALGTPVLGRGGGTVVLQANNLNLQFKLAAASTTLYGYFVTSEAFTPAANSETYTMTIQAIGV